MPKMLLGNILFIAILGGWYVYTDGDRSLMLAGTVMAFGCFVSGIFMGYVLHTPSKRRAAPPEAAMAHQRLIETSSASNSQADEAGHGADSPRDLSIETNEEAREPADAEKIEAPSTQDGAQPVAAEATIGLPATGDKTAAKVETTAESDDPAEDLSLNTQSRF